MAAFEFTTDLFDYFRHKAQDLGCNPCFDGKIGEIRAMNEKGKDGKPGCLCIIKYVPCPCGIAKKQIEEDGMCHCEIFERV